EHIIVLNSLLEEDKLDSPMFIVYAVGATIIKGIIGIYIPLKYDLFIGGLLVCCVIYLMYKVKLVEVIYIYIISTIIVMSTQLISIVFLRIFINSVKYKFIFVMISQITSLILIILIVRHVPIHLIFRFTINNNRTFKILVLNIFILLVSILFYWYADMNGFLSNIITMAVLSAGIIYINLVFIKEGLRNKHKEEQLKIYEDYLPIIEELMSELRGKQHEFDNHIQALRMLAI